MHFATKPLDGQCKSQHWYGTNRGVSSVMCMRQQTDVIPVYSITLTIKPQRDYLMLFVPTWKYTSHFRSLQIISPYMKNIVFQSVTFLFSSYQAVEQIYLPSTISSEQFVIFSEVKDGGGCCLSMNIFARESSGVYIVASIWKNTCENSTTGLRRWGIFLYSCTKNCLWHFVSLFKCVFKEVTLYGNTCYSTAAAGMTSSNSIVRSTNVSDCRVEKNLWLNVFQVSFIIYIAQRKILFKLRSSQHQLTFLHYLSSFMLFFSSVCLLFCTEDQQMHYSRRPDAHLSPNGQKMVQPCGMYFK